MGDEKKEFAKTVQKAVQENASRLPKISDLEMDVFHVGGDFQRRFRGMCQQGAVKFDWNGHHKRRMTKPNAPSSYSLDFRREFGLEEGILTDCIHGFMHSDLEAAKKIYALFDKPGKYLPFMKHTYNYACYQCGEDVQLGFNGKDVKALNKCKFPDGMPPICVNISVPSGKLVFVNYFDGVEPPTDNGRFNGAAGYKLESEHYAKFNIAYGACGNSCPSVLLNAKKDKIIVGKQRYDDDDDEKIVDGFKGYERVGGVITDLWAWSAADLQTAIKVGWAEPAPLDSFKDDVIEVVPGKYRVSQLFHRVDYDNYKIKQKYATIERIGR